MGVIGTILGTAGAASAISGAAGIGSSIATNKSNRNIAQLNNEFNERMLNKQMDYNSQMYERQLGDAWKFYEDQKEYNSAESQRQRYEAAGLNPNLMMGASAGSVQSPSSPQAQGVTPPRATPYTADYSGVSAGIANAIEAYTQLSNSRVERDKVQAETKQINIENQYKAASAVADLTEKLQRVHESKSRVQIAQFLKGFQADLLRAQTTSSQQDAVLKGEQAKLVTLQSLVTNTQLKFLPEQLRTELALSAADIAYRRATTALTEKQVDTEVQKVSESIVRSQYMNVQKFGEIQNQRFDKATMDTRIKIVEEQLKRAINNSTPDNAVKAVLGLPRGIREFFSE